MVLADALRLALPASRTSKASETFRAKKKGEAESEGEGPEDVRTLCTNPTRVQDC